MCEWRGEQLEEQIYTMGVMGLSCFLENRQLFHCEETRCSGVHPARYPAHHQVPGLGGTDYSEYRR